MLKSFLFKVSRHGKQILQIVTQKPGAALKVKNANRLYNTQLNKANTENSVFNQNLATLHKAPLTHFIARCSRKTLVAQIQKEISNGFRNSGMGRAGNILLRSWERVSGKRLLSLYTFLGLSFQAGSREIEITDKQLNGIGKEIKHIVNRKMRLPLTDVINIKLADLELGDMIGKGSYAAVYEARIPPQYESEDDIVIIEQSMEDFHSDEYNTKEISSDGSLTSDIIVLDNVGDLESEDDIVLLKQSMDDFHSDEYDAKEISSDDSLTSHNVLDNIDRFDYDDVRPNLQMNLAVKMMFNYAESNANIIYRNMENEILPTRMMNDNIPMQQWENGDHVKKKGLTEHPNIVQMWGAFVDSVPFLPGAMKHYPAALPENINPDGFGRSKTLFIVMKRYDMTLRDYLRQHKPDIRTSLQLFSQLLEAVVHLTQEQIAHRDLKSDNILISVTPGGLHLVVADFGCCLSDDQNGLVVPYQTCYMFKWGNASLMAPEIACAQPGFNQFLDYRKSDLWAVGTIAYEIFGAPNPFGSAGVKLDSRTYKDDDLPDMPEHAPSAINALVKSILRKNPYQRPDARAAANMLVMMQALPPELLNRNNFVSKLSLVRWLLHMTACFLFEKSSTHQMFEVYTYIKACFLKRIEIDELMDCLEFLKQISIN